MSENLKLSRCGFIVMKFQIDGAPHYLMRRDARWKDINFIGGHERDQDGRSLRRAARRELLEEVPVLRSFNSFDLSPLTDEFSHGPVFSHSAASQVKYQLQFFLIAFLKNPKPLLEKLGTRTDNVLVSQDDLMVPHFHRVSGLVTALDKSLPGGLQRILYSWPNDVGPTMRDISVSQGSQLSLRLN